MEYEIAKPAERSLMINAFAKLNGIALCAMSFFLPIQLFIADAKAQQVYFGVADQWGSLLREPDQWTYVAKHADGFYLNFVMLNRVIQHTSALSEKTLADTCKVFASHRAFLESDIRIPSPGQKKGDLAASDGVTQVEEQRYIDMIHRAGCLINYTSLNYGWSVDRAKNLTSFALDASEIKRFNFAQVAPWGVNGDIRQKNTQGALDTNARSRDSIVASDGVSTDGPLGFWASNKNNFRDGNVSLVQFAHQHNKKAVLMISPYPAGQSSVYDAKKDILATGQDEVRYLESHHATPDVWSIFEYATDLNILPESVDGKAANTFAGLAYWLIYHIRDPEHWVHLVLDNPKSLSNISLVNRSNWLDLAPVIRLSFPANYSNDVVLKIDNVDVTGPATSSGGVILAGDHELMPATTRHLRLESKLGILVATEQTAADCNKNCFVLSFSPGQSVSDDLRDEIRFTWQRQR